MHGDTEDDLRLLGSSASVGRDFSAAQLLFHATVAELAGLSTTDYKCLDLVMRVRGPVTASTLAQLAQLSTGAVTGVVDRLQRAGYVRRVRDRTDRRRVLIEPVAGLEQRFDWIFTPLRAAIRELEATFDEHELRAVHRYLTGAAQVLRRQTQRLREHAAPDHASNE
ncbi:MAG TPA: MarR family winged helix-turn-helix transcriptional regulator [Pseudonocardiaceae bacterium]